MYINYVTYSEIMPNDFPVGKICQDKILYCRDLYSRYGVKCNIPEDKKIHSFDFMSYILFETLMKKTDIKTAQWILFPRTGLMLDSQYAAPELFLKHKYKLNCDFMDVKDCGQLSGFVALSLMFILFKDKKINNALIASINYGLRCDWVAGLSLSENKGIMRVVYCNVIFGKYEITKIVRAFDIEENDVFFVLEETNVSSFSDIEFIYQSIFKVQAISKTIKNNYVFIVSKNNDMDATGFLLLKIK